jgi:hypothetical protein
MQYLNYLPEEFGNGVEERVQKASETSPFPLAGVCLPRDILISV